MTQTPDSVRQWCDSFQARLMAALDEAWETIAATSDPAVIARALARARTCGAIAATVRKIAAMAPAAAARRQTSPAAAGQARTAAPAEPDERDTALPPLTQADIARKALQRLKAGGGRRGRL